MVQSSKIYVAGHQGLVGSALMRHLQKNNFTNIVTRTFKELDLRNQQAVADFFEKEQPEYVLLAAAKVGGIHANNTYKAEFIYDNLMIATNIIHASYKFGVKKLLNLGSSCIYPKLAPQPLKEEYLLSGPLEQTNEPYAVAKIAAIKLCQFYNEQYGTTFISVMPTNLYGPHDNFDLETAHVLPTLLRKFHLAKLLHQNNIEAIKLDLSLFPIGGKYYSSTTNENLLSLLEKHGISQTAVTLWGTGTPYREFLYVEDLAQAVLFLMQNNASVKTLINIGTGQDQTIRDLALRVKETVNYQGLLQFDANMPDGTPRKQLDVSKIHALGWHHSISLENGIKSAYSWYTNQIQLCKENSVTQIISK